MELTPSKTSNLCPGCKQASLEPVTGQMCPCCHTYSGASVARLLHAHTTRLRERLSYLDRVLAAADAMADDLRDGNRTTVTQNVAAYDAIRISLFAPPAAPDAPAAPKEEAK